MKERMWSDQQPELKPRKGNISLIEMCSQRLSFEMKDYCKVRHFMEPLVLIGKVLHASS